MNRLFFVVFLFVACQNSGEKQVSKPEYKDITVSVYASVNVIPNDIYYPQPVRSGIIEKVFVEEGEKVTKGQILFQITPSTEANSKLTDAEINLKQAKSDYLGNDNLLKNIEAELKTLESQVKLDSSNYVKLKRLWDKKIGTKTDLDRALLTYETSSNRYQILKNQYQQSKTNLKAKYNKAVNMLRSDKALLTDYVVYSKIDGTVYEIYKELGDLIQPQERFAEIGNHQDFIIEMDIDEVDISKINLKDTIIIHLEAYPDESFLAELSFIAAKKNQKTQTFKAESIFIDGPEKLFNGLSGEANIIVSKKKQALVIPTEYLIDSDKVLTENGELKVKTGFKNMEMVEILSGIDTSTILIRNN